MASKARKKVNKAMHERERIRRAMRQWGFKNPSPSPARMRWAAAKRAMSPQMFDALMCNRLSPPMPPPATQRIEVNYGGRRFGKSLVHLLGIHNGQPAAIIFGAPPPPPGDDDGSRVLPLTDDELTPDDPEPA